MKLQESETIEFKSAVIGDVKKDVVAFANTKGGTIYIGVDDDGTVAGVQGPAARICEKISSMVHDGIKPDLTVFVQIAEEKYVRLCNTSVPSTDALIRSMIIETDGTSFEQMRSTNQELTFRSAEAVFGKRGISFDLPQKKALRILDRDGIYTNLGLLLSDQCLHTIKIALFKGNEKEEFLKRKEFTGSLFQQLEDAFSFLDLANQLHSSFEGLYRIDKRDYSEIAIREALLNAAIHREYSFSGSTLISVFSNRMEIVSLGGLVPGLELEDVFEGISQSRNPGLADIFDRLNYVEAYGTGIRKIHSECAKSGVRPEFSASNAAFRTILPNSTVVSPMASEVRETGRQPFGIEEEEMQYMQQHYSATRQEIQKTLGLKQTKCGLILKNMEEKGHVRRRGAGRSTIYFTNEECLYRHTT